jgi:hypothetical protein
MLPNKSKLRDRAGWPQVLQILETRTLVRVIILIHDTLLLRVIILVHGFWR